MDQARDITFSLTGLSCAACVGRAERALARVPGVAGASVNLATGRASMTLTGPDALPAALQALDKAGYPAALVTTRLDVDGMTCAACTGRVERALAKLPGVTAAAANLAARTVSVTHDPGVSAAALMGAVRRAGYSATLPQDAAAGAPRVPDDERLRRNLMIAAVLTLPLFVIEMGGHAFAPFHAWLMTHADMRALGLFEMALALAVLVWPGRVFLSHGIPALVRGAPDMNSLVALGSGAAFLYSAVVTLAPGLVPEPSRHVYFEAAAVIVTLILLGRWLEARARGKAGQAIRRLVELAPSTACVLRQGHEETVPVAELVPGDIVRLLPGERVPADGEIAGGSGAIDESMLTGEPVPAVKSPGDPVTAGTVNGASALTMRVRATGADTALARIVRLVEDAQAAKLPVQAMVDRVTRVFVPTVMALAAATFAAWLVWGPGLAQAVVAAVSVLIIACPCAMGLAVPVSIMVGTGRGAELGILFRRGDALQRLAGARTVGFDKTGTLTLGRPSLVRLHPAEGVDQSEVLRLAAAAEMQSEHPLAAAVVTAARDRGLAWPQATQVRAIAGRGLAALVEGREVLIGNLAVLNEAGVPPDPALASVAEDLAAEGATPVHLALGGVHAAVMGMADPLRAGAAEAIAALHRLGLRTEMISGDVPAAAEAAGRQLGVGRVTGGVLPEGKLDAIRAMGPGSVFVGDGINDAPALAAAGTGIAIGTGTDVAIEAAEVVLSSGDPAGVARAIRLSRAVMANIRQNLFWAFAYNAALIPVAMGVLVPFGGPQLSPMLGAGAMALSSVFVVTNALRLRRFA